MPRSPKTRWRSAHDLAIFLAVFAGCLLPLTLAPAQPPAEAPAVEPLFLTTAEKPRLKSDDGKEEKEIWVPTAQRILHAWSDQAFAINIPLQMPQGAVVHSFDISMAGLTLPVAGGAGRQPVRTSLFSFGIYRADERDVQEPKGTGVYFKFNERFSFSRGFTHMNGMALSEWLSSDYDLNGRPDGQPQRITLTARNSVAPGRAIFWIVPNLSWKGPEFVKNEINIEITVKPVEFKVQPPGASDYQARPTGAPQVFRFRIRENGFVPHSAAKPRFSEQWNEPYDAGESQFTVADSDTRCDGKTLSSATRFVDKGPKKLPPLDRRWDAELPPIFWDFSQSEPLKVVKLTQNESPIKDWFTPWVHRDEVTDKFPRLSTGGTLYRDFVRGPDGRGLWFYYQVEGYRDPAVREAKGPQPVLGIAFVEGEHRWTKTVPINCVRLSELEKNTDSLIKKDTAVAAEVAGDDGHWEWLERHLILTEDSQARCNEIRIQLATLHNQQQKLRAEWYGMMQDEMSIPMPGDIADTSWLPGTEDEMAFAGPRAATVRKAQREKVAARVAEIHTEQQALVTEATNALNALVNSVKEQAAKANKPRRELLKKELARTEDQAAVAQVYFYDAAGWYEPHELPRLIADLKLDSNAHDGLARLMRARSLKAQSEAIQRRIWLQSISPTPRTAGPMEDEARTLWIQAFTTIRGLALSSPGNTEANALLMEMELHAIQGMLARLDAEKRLSLEEMGQYLANRGFNPDSRGDWWVGVKEFVNVWWGSGPITLSAGTPWLMSWLPDAVGGGGINVPEEVAKRAITINDSAAMNHVSLLVVRTLRQNGVPMNRMLTLTPREFLEAVNWRTAAGNEMEPERAHRLQQDMHATFAEMGDLRALAEGRMEAYQQLSARSYYGTMDPKQSWGEWVGDLFSPRHLVTIFGPYAIARVGGTWAVSGMTTASEIRLLEGMGEITRAREALIVGLRLDRMGQWFTRTGAGAALQRALIADQQLTAGLKGVDWAVNGGARLVAAVVILGGAPMAAEANGFPILAQVLNAFAEFGGEEIAFEMLTRKGTPVRKLLGSIDDYGRWLDTKQAELQQLRDTLAKLEDATGRLKLGETGLSDTRTASLVQGALGQAAPENLTETAGNGILYAMREAAQALRAGDKAEAARALRAANNLTRRLGEHYDTAASRLVQMRMKLDAGWSERVVPKIGQAPKLVDIRVPDRFRLADELYDGSPAGQALLKADEALQAGDLVAAERIYVSARQRARSAGVTDLATVLDDRIALVANARRIGKTLETWRASVKPNDAFKSISDDEVRAVIDDLQRSGTVLEYLPGSLNPVFRFRDSAGNRWFLKIPHSDIPAAHQAAELRQLRCEATANALANAVGLSAPGAKSVALGKLRTTADDPRLAEIVATGVLYRDVTGVNLLQNVPEALVVAMKDDYARQRVFRAWLADTDGHLKNQLLAQDGRWWSIDFGFSNLTADKTLRQIGEWAPDEPTLMLQSMELVCSRFEDSHPHLYKWMIRMDQMIGYNDMKPTVDAIKALCADEPALRGVLSPYMKGPELEEAVKTLIERSKFLDGQTGILQRFLRRVKSVLLDPDSLPFRRYLPEGVPLMVAA